MKNFIKSILVFSTILLSFFTVAYIMRPVKSQNYLAAINNKILSLDTIPSPRIIFIGGSNVCFGIDSKRISDSIGLPVIDTGLHASIGLKMQLDLVELKMRPADILVIMPEIQQFYGGLNGESPTLSSIITLLDPKINTSEILKTINFHQLANIISGLPDAIYHQYRSITVSDSIYNANGFNQYGDQQTHWNDSSQYKTHKISSSLVPISKAFDSSSITYLSDKINSLCSKGGKVILFPPTMIQSYYQLNEDKLHNVYQKLSDKGIYFDIKPDAHVMPDEYAYDTMYHLNKLGVDSLSGLLIREVKTFGFN